jgi:beta-glucuronidase
MIHSRERLSLCGEWKYRVNGGAETIKIVPFSALCTGKSHCTKIFDLTRNNTGAGRALLVFEGITYRADIVLNGKKIGVMLPFCPYVFDITALLREKGNVLELDLTDMNLPFGPSEGWENYGGIIRDVYLEFVSDVWIGNVFWRTKFNKTFDSTEASVKLELKNFPAKGKGGMYRVRTVLKDRNRVIAEAGTETAAAKPELKFRVDNPALWSPDAPNLYTLETVLYKDGAETDRLIESVGFKELRAAGNRFFLNGEPIFLKGVCRHDIWGECGHTLSDAQMQRDMCMIKGAGCNFVRLVHYPHNKKIIDLADRLGLLVSEEPGLWWSDLKNPETTKAALEVFKRVIRRDRSRISLAFWFAFNECILTHEFLSAAAKTARKNDPTRLVSGANCMSPDVTKKMFSEHNFDFYTYHPYGSHPGEITGGFAGEKEGWRGSMSMAKVMEILDDKPLLFSEWGGYYPIGNRRLMCHFLDVIIAAGKSTEKGKTLAGMSFWQWNDIYEHNRGFPACKDGILAEGLVDINRNAKEDLDIFSRKLAETAYTKEENVEVEIYGFHQQGSYIPIDIRKCVTGAESFKNLCETYLPVKGYRYKNTRNMKHGPALPWDIYRLGEMPVLLRKGPPVAVNVSSGPALIPVNVKAWKLCLIGQVAFGEAYPLTADSRLLGTVDVVFDSGEEYHIPLRNGIEVCTVFGTIGPSRLDPRAQAVRRVMKICYDPNWEQYFLNALELTLPHQGKIKILRLSALDKEITLLLYGITAYAE